MIILIHFINYSYIIDLTITIQVEVIYMIALGIDPGGASQTVTPVIVGLDVSSANSMNFYNNSVYIGGSGVGANAVNTFAFRKKSWRSQCLLP